MMASQAVLFSIRRCALVILLANAAVPFAHSQDAAPAANNETGQCAYLKPRTAEQAALLESVLVPGQKLDVAAMMADPKVAAFMRDMKAQEQVRFTQDWAQLCTYKEMNAEQSHNAAPQVVFFGDSITEFWGVADPSFFSHKTLDRGISGQTSSQMLLRFYNDVVLLHPRAVHLLAGTNDVAQNTGPISNEDYLANVRAMIDLAQAHHIKVALASILPVKGFAYKPQITGVTQRVLHLNQELQLLAKQRKLLYVDYYSALDDGEGAMNPKLSNDGVHPNRDGYAHMRPIAEKAMATVLGGR